MVVKQCMYCKSDIDGGSVIDFCERCGKHVFGERMFNAIINNMQAAEKRGDLEQT